MTWTLVVAATWLLFALVAAVLVGRSIRMGDAASPDEAKQTGSTSADLVDDELIRLLLTEGRASETHRPVRRAARQLTTLSPTGEFLAPPAASGAPGISNASPAAEGTSPSQNPG